jgi:chromosome segregation ATPase
MTSITVENIERIHDIEVLRRLCIGLAKQRDKMKETQARLESELAQSPSDALDNVKSLHSAEVADLTRQINTLQQRLSDQDGRLESQTAALRSLEAENQSLREIGTGALDAKSACERELQGLRESLSALRDENASLEEVIANVHAAKRQSEVLFAEAIAERDAAERDRKVCQQRNKEFAKAIRELQSRLAALKAPADGEAPSKLRSTEADLASARSELQMANDALAEARAQLEKVRQVPESTANVELARVKAENVTLHAELQSLRELSGASEDEYEGVVGAMAAKLGAEMAKLISEKEGLETRMAGAENQIKDAEQLSQQSDRADRAEKKVAELMEQNQSLQARIADLEGLALIGEKSTSRCAELQKQLHEFQEGVVKPLTAKADLFDSTKSQLDLVVSELSQLKQVHETLSQDFQHKSTSLRSVAEELSKSQNQTVALMSKVNSLSARCDDLSQKVDDLTLVSNEQQNLIAKKDKMLVKLKVLLNNYVTSDQRKQEQIDSLQNEILRYVGRRVDSARGNEGSLRARVVELEGQVKELERRLNEGQASAELQARNAQLMGMLERSNLLYGQLMNQDRPARRGSGQLRIVSCDSLVMEPRANMGHREAAVSLKMHEQVVMINKYLKTTLIQFFGQDAANRSQMVPLILELAGCNRQQIRAAQRQWERSNQLIHKTAGFFGL